jgi:hypothetical protein
MGGAPGPADGSFGMKWMVTSNLPKGPQVVEK